jgi:hypothetical protein
VRVRAQVGEAELLRFRRFGLLPGVEGSEAPSPCLVNIVTCATCMVASIPSPCFGKLDVLSYWFELLCLYYTAADVHLQLRFWKVANCCFDALPMLLCRRWLKALATDNSLPEDVLVDSPVPLRVAKLQPGDEQDFRSSAAALDLGRDTIANPVAYLMKMISTVAGGQRNKPNITRCTYSCICA